MTKRKKSTKHELFLPTSDEEADTVVDRFWRNLNEGLLPEDLCRVDLYSGVGSRLTIVVIIIIVFICLNDVTMHKRQYNHTVCEQDIPGSYEH